MKNEMTVKEMNFFALSAYMSELGFGERELRILYRSCSSLFGVFYNNSLKALFSCTEKNDKIIIKIAKTSTTTMIPEIGDSLNTLGSHLSRCRDKKIYFEITEDAQSQNTQIFEWVKNGLPPSWSPLQPHMLHGRGYAENLLKAKVFSVHFKRKDFSILPWETHNNYALMKYDGSTDWVPKELNPFLMEDTMEKEISYILIVEGKIAGWFVNSFYAENVYNTETAYIHPVYKKQMFLVELFKYSLQKLVEKDKDNQIVWVVDCNKFPEVVRFYSKYFKEHSLYINIIYRASCKRLNP